MMNLLESYRRQRAKRLFPKEKKKFWYCYEFNEYQYKLFKAGEPYSRREIELPCETFLVDHLSGVPQEGMVIPCQKLDGWIAYYRVTKVDMYSSPGSDFASWDDGKIIDLRLVRCERA